MSRSNPVIGNVYYDDKQFTQKFFNGRSRPILSIDDLNGVDILVFYGGEDISPALYGETVAGSHSRNLPSGRDKFETLVFQHAKGVIPMLGICRGAQLITALTGGKLWQHVDNHSGPHPIVLPDGSRIMTNSLHHQMMRPTIEMEIIATTENALSPKKRNMHGIFENDQPEPEICYHPEVKAILVQGHPEYYGAPDDLVTTTRNLVRKYCGV